MSKFIFELGVKAKDKITGFEGIIIGRAEHITGCNTYGLKPKKDKDGKMQDAEWVDEGCPKDENTGDKHKVYWTNCDE